MPLPLNNIFNGQGMSLKARLIKRISGCSLILFFLIFIEASYARQPIPIKGMWDAVNQKISVEMAHGGQRPFFLEIEQKSKTLYDLNLTIVNWVTDFFNLSTVLEGALTVVPPEIDEKFMVNGRLTSRYTLLNQRPFDELKADFFIQDGNLVFRSLCLGEISGSGKISLNGQPIIDMAVYFEDFPLASMAQFIPSAGNGVEVEGNISGEIKLQGPIDKLQIKGNMNSYNGVIGEYAYDAAQINFTGIYPVIYVENSHISQMDGLSFEVQGSLELTDFKNIKKQLENFVGVPLISQKGKTVEWTFKRLESDQKRGATELKYMIKRDERSGEDANVLGVQRRIEF